MEQLDLKTQTLMNQISNQTAPPMGMSTTFGQCPQCGLIHPPLKPNEKCPNAPIKNEKGEKVDVEKFIVALKNILISQIDQKKIKEPENLFKFITIEIFKILEKYEE